jgi:hypothetical protein
MVSCVSCLKQLEDNYHFLPFSGTKLPRTQAPPLEDLHGVSSEAPGQPPSSGEPSLGGPPQEAPYGKPTQPSQPLSDPGGQEQHADPSPKKRNTVIFLCFFLGLLGLHRFYLGKIGTAILMILTICLGLIWLQSALVLYDRLIFFGTLTIITFGGLGIWWLVDFFNAIFGNYTDSRQRPVDKRYCKPFVIGLILFGIFAFISVFPSLAISINNKYRDITENSPARQAYNSVALAEMVFFASYGYYTDSYENLTSIGALKLNPYVYYGDIELIFDPKTREHGFKFKVMSKYRGNLIYYEYDSLADPSAKLRWMLGGNP